MNLQLPNLDTASGDLEFLLGVIFNQQIRADVAWRAPTRLRERLGSLDALELADLEPEELGEVLRRKPAVHPFAATMARNVVGTCQVLVRDYDAQAHHLWSDQPTADTLLRRLIAFPGIGHHKATVAIALLAHEYDVPIGSDGTSLAAEALRSCPRLAEVLTSPQGEADDVAADRTVRRRGPMLHHR